LRADKTNEANLDAIERCMLVLCLDGATPPPTTLHCHSPEGDCAAARDDVSLAEQMIHGHGSSVNSANRWFEKTMQVNEHRPQFVRDVSFVRHLRKICGNH